MKNNNLYTENRFIYFLSRFREGLSALMENPLRLLCAVLFWAGVIAYILWPSGSTVDRLFHPIVSVFLLVGALLLFVSVITASAIPRGAHGIANAFRTAGVTNSAGLPPLVVSKEEHGEKTVVELCTSGLSPEQLDAQKAQIESALTKRIIKIEQGRDNSHVALHLVPGDTKLPDMIPLPRHLSTKDSELLLGESLDGPVKIDLDKTPHSLVGGSTGCGKSSILRSIIYQLLCKNKNGVPLVDVTLIDMKGGQDYHPRWRGQDCSFARTPEDALSLLSMLVQELERREQLFAQMSEWKNTPCSCLADYNKLCPPGSQLRRNVIVVDEIAVLTDTTGRDKHYKELSNAIVGKLFTISCLGRAFGINLIIGTQRPDANAVPGGIKSNIDFRICGKADNTLSMIILDNTSAADLIPPDSQGLFVTRDGVVFRAYLFDDDSMQGGCAAVSP